MTGFLLATLLRIRGPVPDAAAARRGERRPAGDHFLAVISAEFALCFAAYYLLRNKAVGSNWWGLIAGGAVLFRITLLPAGLPPELSWREKFAAMRFDWRGESVTYERFQLFDDDIWRYLWDGHVAARGANPYTAVPADPSMDNLLTMESGGHPDWETIRGNINYPRIPTIYPPLAQWFSAPHIGWRRAACWP